KTLARAALSRSLENPGPLDPALLLTLAQLDGDATVTPALERLIARDDLPTATVARAILLLKAKGGLSKGLGVAAGKRLLNAVATGALRITAPADQLMIFELLEAEGPSDFALKQIAGHLRDG